MSQIIINDRNYFLKKRLTTVGTDHGCDIKVEADVQKPTPFFQLGLEGGEVEILPGSVKLTLNGVSLSKRTKIKSCDRIEWPGGACVYLSRFSGSGGADRRALDALKELTQWLPSLDEKSGDAAFKRLLESLVDISGAEDGFVLADSGGKSGWQLVASTKDQALTAKERGDLFSDSILGEALKKRGLVFIESIIGNPHASAESVILAKIFSVACFPLMLGEKVVGAVVLQTHTPGKMIARDTLEDLSILATQATLLLLTLKTRPTGRGAIPQRGFVYQSKIMEELMSRIKKVAQAPLSALILGETGTGKELCAKEIHDLSPRKSGPFVAINCAAIPATLLESALFGYERGAFTGAVKSQPGKFEAAHGGTIFLDEIGDLPLELQAKLLRVLQEKKVERLGSNQSISVDIRIVSATHRNLEAMIKEGSFRQDLYFRLAGATVKLPPLRERKEDIAPLVAHFTKKLGSMRAMSPQAMQALESHPWPGNVRELEHVVTSAVLLSDGGELEPIELSALDLKVLDLPLAEDSFFWESYPTLDEAQLAFTQKIVKGALDQAKGNRAQAAKRLGISERTLYRILSEDAGGTGKSGRGTAL